MAKGTCVKCDGPIAISEPNSKGLRNWKCKDSECGAGGYYDHQKKEGSPQGKSKSKKARPAPKDVPLPELQPAPEKEPIKPAGADADAGTGANSGTPGLIHGGPYDNDQRPWYERGPKF